MAPCDNTQRCSASIERTGHQRRSRLRVRGGTYSGPVNAHIWIVHESGLHEFAHFWQTGQGSALTRLDHAPTLLRIGTGSATHLTTRPRRESRAKLRSRKGAPQLTWFGRTPAPGRRRQRAQSGRTCPPDGAQRTSQVINTGRRGEATYHDQFDHQSTLSTLYTKPSVNPR
jgi:hypothetical protein